MRPCNKEANTMKAKVRAIIEEKLAATPAPEPEETEDGRVKITIAMPVEMQEKIKALCRQYDLYLHNAYTTGMANWIAGMEGRSGYRPIYGPDHDALEDILRANNPSAVAALRAVLAAFKPS